MVKPLNHAHWVPNMLGSQIGFIISPILGRHLQEIFQKLPCKIRINILRENRKKPIPKDLDLLKVVGKNKNIFPFQNGGEKL